MEYGYESGGVLNMALRVEVCGIWLESGGVWNGGLPLKPPKFEHIFVAVITFFPFLLCKYF